MTLEKSAISIEEFISYETRCSHCKFFKYDHVKEALKLDNTLLTIMIEKIEKLSKNIEDFTKEDVLKELYKYKSDRDGIYGRFK